MAIDKRLKIYDEQGNEVDYDILATDVKFLPDGKDLPAKLDELEQEIGEGYAPPQGGIPKTDLAPSVQTSLDKADTSVQDPNYVHTSNDYTDGEKTKLAGLPTGSELTTALGNKANDADVVKSISVNGTAQQKDAQGNVAISGLATSQQLAAKQDALVSGTNIKTVNSQSLLGNGDIVIQGEKGDTGNVEFEDLDDLVALLVNDLTTGGGGNFLSAEMGLVLRREITRVHDDLVTLYGKLANMAFWDAADRAAAQPRSLNFNVPQVSLSFDLTGVGSGVSVKLNGESFNSPVSVDKGGTNTLTIQAIEDWALNNDIAVTIDGVAQTLTQSGGIYSLEFSVNAPASIEVVGTATQEWFIAQRNDVSSGGTVTRYGWQEGRSINTEGGYSTAGMANGSPASILIPAGYQESVKKYTSDYVVTSPSNYGNSNSGKTAASYIPTGGKRYLNVKISDSNYDATAIYRIAVGCYGSAAVGNTQSDYFDAVQVIDGWKSRLGYFPTNNAPGLTEFKVDLSQAGADVSYIKLLFKKRTSGNVDIPTPNYIDNLSIKYKFTDD